MISIRYSDIPGFLHRGSFYEALGTEEQNEEIQIPTNCISPDGSINNLQDFWKMLKVTAFWGLHHIPTTLVQYCWMKEPNDWVQIVRSEFIELDFTQDLLSVFEANCDQNDVNSTALARAIAIGNDDIVTFLVAHENDSAEPAACAAAKGRLDYLKLLHQHGHPWDETACEMAARERYLDCLQYLHEHGCPWNYKTHMAAAETGSLAIMTYAFEQDLPWPITLCEKLAEGNHSEMLQYAIDRRLPLNTVALVKAAAGGHFDCLEVFLIAQCPASVEAAWCACENGHFECLQLLHHFGVPWDVSLASSAAAKGDLDILQYLHENGCPWDEDTTLSAVRSNQLNTLRYAVENGCEMDTDIIYYSVSAGGIDCLRYLIEELHLNLEDPIMSLLEAFKSGNFEALRCLIEHCGPFGSEDLFLNDELEFSVYEHLQYNKSVSYDENLLRCINCAVDDNWAVVAGNSRFAAFVCDNASHVPLCAAFYQAKISI